MKILMILGIIALSITVLRQLGGIYVAAISDKISPTMKVVNAFEAILCATTFVLLVINYYNG